MIVTMIITNVAHDDGFVELSTRTEGLLDLRTMSHKFSLQHPNKVFLTAAFPRSDKP
jgi:transcriptional accessory protein Tex/SPT6